MQGTRAIVHLDNFLRNFKAIQGRVGQRHICVSVKDDAYGHGAAAIAHASLEAGAAFLAVAKVSEGASLREAGINAPILLLSQPFPGEIPEIIKNNLFPLVSDGEFAAMLDREAAAAGVRLPVHLKIDTGMGRMGCHPQDAAALAKCVAACNALEYAGTATHFAVADSADSNDYAYTEWQVDCFNAVLDCIRSVGLNPGIVHAANSGAIILHPRALFDMVRPGILLYGYKAVEEGEWGVGNGEPLLVEPVMELRTNVVLITRVKKGETISYGRTWAAPQDTNVAVLPVGYGDGLPRLLSGKWQALIGGETYPLVGRICMDQCMANLGPDSKVCRWDEAVIFGGPAPGAADIAGRIGTIPYEITCNINKRVPRVYARE
ncbi:MAG: alanine racemase [Treponema sp.]|jgi:alanine racemase|nr:alanine racemase [Treponema sp.]